MTYSAQQHVAVHRSARVPLPPARAFDLFTSRMGAFWPSDHSIGSAAITDVVIEPWAGGRWFERGVDGSECDWGRVSVWQPPELVVLLWQIGADWTMQPDLETEVVVSFTEDSPGHTRVNLTHRGLERYGEAATTMHAVFDSPNGWAGILTHFTELAADNSDDS